MSERELCDWAEDDDGNWASECGELFVFTTDGPIANGMKFCCYCGMRLGERPYEPPADDED